ncbi:MAG: hypothetical protein Q7U08_05525 [Flavobacteriaceae bacterium]|jgi:hypothetical protein|nr:hypothetical protein [Flavobacteriaceae bacterium]
MTVSTHAQKYYVYDSPDFNVMIKANTENTQVLEISFTDSGKTKWIKFEIEDFYDYEDTDKGGFTYLVKDGKNDRYYVDYFRTSDYIIVTKEGDTTGFKWTLYRRVE